MDHNLPVKTKKIWNIIHAVLFMLKKGVSKSKLKLELNLLTKRGKIAGKAMISNLMFHHHHNHTDGGPREYEFSCSNSPANFRFHLNKFRGRNHQHYRDEESIVAQLDEHDLTSLNSVDSVLERLNSDALILRDSPVFPALGRSSIARQLRITDSPLQEVGNDHGQVDKAADEFIKKFYRQLKQQRKLSKEEYHC